MNGRHLAGWPSKVKMPDQEKYQHMSYFQILSTQVRFDGWMDMNILTPFGVVSIEFRLDDESLNSLSISDFIWLDKDNCLKNKDEIDNDILNTLLMLAEMLADKDRRPLNKPIDWVQKRKFCRKPLNVMAN